MDSITAKYFDGRSSQAHIIHCQLDSKGITLEVAGGNIIWKFEQIIVLERPHDSKPMVLAATQQDTARLVIEDIKAYQKIIPHIPNKHIKVSHVHHPWRILFIVMAFITAILAFAVWGVPYYAPSLAKKIPPSWDDRLGQWAIASVASNRNICINEAGVKALQKLAKNLSANQNIDTKFDVQVLDFHFVNAFSVPGFHVVLAKGLLDAAKTPDEVAGVLAHEMAHSIEHHPTAGLLTEIGISVIFAAAFGSSPDFGVQMLNFSYSRKYEFEADKVGTHLLNQANISATGLINFFKTLNEDTTHLDKYLKYISTHPPSQERIDQIKQLDETTNAKPSLTPKEWKDLQNICQDKKPFKL